MARKISVTPLLYDIIFYLCGAITYMVGGFTFTIFGLIVVLLVWITLATIDSIKNNGVNNG